MVRHLSELPVVRCPGCNRPMDPQERASVTARLVDIRYVCAVCGMETKRTVKEDIRRPQGFGTRRCPNAGASLRLEHASLRRRGFGLPMV